MKEKRDCCPVCGSFNIVVGDDYAYCDRCRWGEKSYDIEVVIEDTSGAVENAVNKIQDFLVANNCMAKSKDLQARFINMNGLDNILTGMEVQDRIKTFYTADGESWVALTRAIGKKVEMCDWADIEISFSTDNPPYNMIHYRIPCRLTKEQQEEMRQDINGYADEWVKSL